MVTAEATAQAPAARAATEERFSGLLRQTSWVGLVLGGMTMLRSIFGPPLDDWLAASLAGATLFFLYAFTIIAVRTNGLGRGLWLATAVFLIVEIARIGHDASVAAHGDFFPRLVAGLYGSLTGLLLYAYLSRRMNSVYGLLGFFFFVSLPAMARIDRLAAVDAGAACFSTAALLCILRWREEGSSSWLILAALSTGFALRAQAVGVFAAAVLALVFVVAAASRSGNRAAVLPRQLSLFIVLAATPAAALLLKNSFDAASAWAPFTSAQAIAQSALFYPDGLFAGLSPVLVVFLPWAFSGKWLDDKKSLLAFSLGFVILAGLFVDPQPGYLLPAAPPLVALMVYGVFNAHLRIKQPAYLFAVLLCFALLHGVYLWR